MDIRETLTIHKWHMDTEELNEIAHHRALGKPETDEGPFYHESWWEAYKGGVKGIFGGLIIGAGVGLVMGTIAAGLLGALVLPEMTAGIFVTLAAGFSGLGAVLGAHEFSQVGIVTGAVAAAHEKAEERIKEFEDSRFGQIKQEIAGLRAAVTGGVDTPAVQQAMAEVAAKSDICAEVDAKHDGYRTQHCNDEHCPPTGIRPVFLKVGLIGAGMGAAAGALLGYSGLFGEMLEPLNHAVHGTLTSGQLLGASTIIGGTLGASFGVNRDMFRKVFDTTDRAFRGILPGEEQSPKKCDGPGISDCKEHDAPTRILMETAKDTARSSTHFQDRLQKEALTKALLSIDHTTAVRQ